MSASALPPQVRAMQVFVEEMGRWPSRTAPYAAMPWDGPGRPTKRRERHWLDYTERELAIWLSNQRQHAGEQRRHLLDEQLPGWEDQHYHTSRTSTEELAQALAAALAEGGWDVVRANTDLSSRLSSARSACRAALMSPENRALLDENAPGWQEVYLRPRGPRKSVFDRRLADLVRWREENEGRWPSQKSDSARERSLAGFVTYMRSNATPDMRAVLDERAPGWATPRNGKGGTESPYAHRMFTERLEQLRATVAAGEAPTGALQDWLARQRRNQRLSAHRRKALDQVYPEWRQTAASTPAAGRPRTYNREILDRRIRDLKQWREDTGQNWPSTRSPLKAERSLGVWILGMRRNAVPEARDRLTQELPGWDVPRQAGGRGNLDEVGAARRLKDLKAFVQTHGRSPSEKSDDPGEVALARWVSRSLYRKSHASPRILAIIGEKHERQQRQWSARIADLERFIQDHGHLPRDRGPGVPETLLRQWMVRQRDRATPEQCADLDRRAPGWRGRGQGWRAA